MLRNVDVLIALWSKDCSDGSYTDSKYNRDCDVTIYSTVRAAKSRKRGSMEVHNCHCCKLIQSNLVTIPPRCYATLDAIPLLIMRNKIQHKLNRK